MRSFLENTKKKFLDNYCVFYFRSFYFFCTSGTAVKIFFDMVVTITHRVNTTVKQPSLTIEVC